MSDETPREDFETYRNRPGINNSKLKAIDPDKGGCPEGYRAACDHPEDGDTHSRRGLRLVHALVLEPHNFGRDYYEKRAHAATVAAVMERIDDPETDHLITIMVQRDLDLPARDYVISDHRANSAMYKAIVEVSPDAVIVKSKAYDDADAKYRDVAHDIQAGRDGKTPVTAKQVAAAREAAAAVLAHPVAGPIVSGDDGESEVDLSYTDEATGLLCKGRADRRTPGWTWDLKSMQDASPRGVEREIGRMRYDVQGAHYTEDNGNDFGIIAVAKRRGAQGYTVGVYRLGPAWMETGRAKRAELMAMVAECTAADHWPGHTDDEPRELDNPPAYLSGDSEESGITFDHTEVPHG